MNSRQAGRQAAGKAAAAEGIKKIEQQNFTAAGALCPSDRLGIQTFLTWNA